MNDWNYCGVVLPDENVEVETKIDDEKGCRNQAVLRRHRNLWWLRDMSMYVYYSPTHWRSMQPKANQGAKS